MIDSVDYYFFERLCNHNHRELVVCDKKSGRWLDGAPLLGRLQTQRDCWGELGDTSAARIKRPWGTLKAFLGGAFMFFSFQALLGKTIPNDKYFLKGLKPPIASCFWKDPMASAEGIDVLFVHLFPRLQWILEVADETVFHISKRCSPQDFAGASLMYFPEETDRLPSGTYPTALRSTCWASLPVYQATMHIVQHQNFQNPHDIRSRRVKQYHKWARTN